MLRFRHISSTNYNNGYYTYTDEESSAEYYEEETLTEYDEEESSAEYYEEETLTEYEEEETSIEYTDEEYITKTTPSHSKILTLSPSTHALTRHQYNQTQRQLFNRLVTVDTELPSISFDEFAEQASSKDKATSAPININISHEDKVETTEVYIECYVGKDGKRYLQATVINIDDPGAKPQIFKADGDEILKLSIVSYASNKTQKKDEYRTMTESRYNGLCDVIHKQAAPKAYESKTLKIDTSLYTPITDKAHKQNLITHISYCSERLFDFTKHVRSMTDILYLIHDVMRTIVKPGSVEFDDRRENRKSMSDFFDGMRELAIFESKIDINSFAGILFVPGFRYSYLELVTGVPLRLIDAATAKDVQKIIKKHNGRYINHIFKTFCPELTGTIYDHITDETLSNKETPLYKTIQMLYEEQSCLGINHRVSYSWRPSKYSLHNSDIPFSEMSSKCVLKNDIATRIKFRYRTLMYPMIEPKTHLITDFVNMGTDDVEIGFMVAERKYIKTPVIQELRAYKFVPIRLKQSTEITCHDIRSEYLCFMHNLYLNNIERGEELNNKFKHFTFEGYLDGSWSHPNDLHHYRIDTVHDFDIPLYAINASRRESMHNIPQTPSSDSIRASIPIHGSYISLNGLQPALFCRLYTNERNIDKKLSSTETIGLYPHFISLVKHTLSRKGITKYDNIFLNNSKRAVYIKDESLASRSKAPVYNVRRFNMYAEPFNRSAVYQRDSRHNGILPNVIYVADHYARLSIPLLISPFIQRQHDFEELYADVSHIVDEEHKRLYAKTTNCILTHKKYAYTIPIFSRNTKFIYELMMLFLQRLSINYNNKGVNLRNKPLCIGIMADLMDAITVDESHNVTMRTCVEKTPDTLKRSMTDVAGETGKQHIVDNNPLDKFTESKSRDLFVKLCYDIRRQDQDIVFIINHLLTPINVNKVTVNDNALLYTDPSFSTSLYHSLYTDKRVVCDFNYLDRAIIRYIKSRYQEEFVEGWVYHNCEVWCKLMTDETVEKYEESIQDES